MLIVRTDAAAVEADLVAGRVTCPNCGSPDSSVGHDIEHPCGYPCAGGNVSSAVVVKPPTTPAFGSPRMSTATRPAPGAGTPPTQ